MGQGVRARTWAVVQPDSDDRRGRTLGWIVTVLVAVNVLAVVLLKVEAVAVRFGALFDDLAVVSIVFVTVVDLLRLWAAPADPAYRGPIRGRLRFLAQPVAVIDVLVVVPFYAGLAVGSEALTAVRLFWLLRLFLTARLSRSRRRFRRVVDARRDDLQIAFSLGATGTLFSATLLYFVERGAQPEAFSSIPAALWWAVVTFTTVGYGDVVPATPLGQLLGSLTAIAGVTFIALPASILAAGFLDETTAGPAAGTETDGGRSRQVTCPHCDRPHTVAADGRDEPSA